jgi:hypothetical protein
MYIIRKGSTLGGAFGFAFAEHTLNNKDASSSMPTNTGCRCPENYLIFRLKEYIL